ATQEGAACLPARRGARHRANAQARAAAAFRLGQSGKPRRRRRSRGGRRHQRANGQDDLRPLPRGRPLTVDSDMVQRGVSPAAPRGAAPRRFWNLPNVLTYGRIIAIPALVVCFFATGDWGRWTAMWIFIAAGLSDFLDGYLARAWQQQSAIGRMLDPIADKLIVAAALLMLAADQTIAGWS